MGEVIMNKLLISQFTSHYGIKLIESGLFDDDTFEQYSPREVQQLSGSKRSNLPIDLDDLYDSFVEITTDFDQNYFQKIAVTLAKVLDCQAMLTPLLSLLLLVLLNQPFLSL